MILLDEFSPTSNGLMAALASRQDEWLYWQIKEILVVEYFYRPAPFEHWTEKMDAKLVLDLATPSRIKDHMGKFQMRSSLKDLSPFMLCSNALKEARQVDVPFEDIPVGTLDAASFKRETTRAIEHFQKIRLMVEELGPLKFEKMKKDRALCELEMTRTKNSKGFLDVSCKFRAPPELKLPKF